MQAIIFQLEYVLHETTQNPEGRAVLNLAPWRRNHSASVRPTVVFIFVPTPNSWTFSVEKEVLEKERNISDGRGRFEGACVCFFNPPNVFMRNTAMAEAAPGGSEPPIGGESCGNRHAHLGSRARALDATRPRSFALDGNACSRGELQPAKPRSRPWSTRAPRIVKAIAESANSNRIYLARIRTPL